MVLAAGLQLSLVERKSSKSDETWVQAPEATRSSFLGGGDNDDGSLSSESEITNAEISSEKVKNE